MKQIIIKNLNSSIMKKLLLILLLTVVFQGYSQTQGISYQAVIINPNVQEVPGVDIQGNILANTVVGIQFTITDYSGNEEFQEIHTTSTDKYGMINLLIGAGDTSSNKNFSDINWDGTLKILVVAIDFTGGTSYEPLSEQNLTYMPQPINKETKDLITNNTRSILEEKNRAIAAEGLNSEGISLNANVLAINTIGVTTNATSIVAETVRANASEVINADGIVKNTDEIATNRAVGFANLASINTETIRAITAEGINADGIATNANGITINTTGV
ncbi:MAG: hypothetical protein ACJASR_002450, partial [Psychroserpens sp.]